VFIGDILVKLSTPEFELPLEQAAYPIHICNTGVNISDTRNFVASFPEPVRVDYTHYRTVLIKNVTIAVVMDDSNYDLVFRRHRE
jgi:hypothetical protein